MSEGSSRPHHRLEQGDSRVEQGDSRVEHGDSRVERSELSIGEALREELSQYERGSVDQATFDARSGFSILIHGENRIAHNLLALLFGSGFSHVRIVSPSKNLPASIEAPDFNGLSITKQNLGERRSATHSRIRMGADISFSDAGAYEQNHRSDQKPNLIISTSRSQGDYRQRWMSESTPHLYIDCEADDLAWIGPYVVPGSHPCLNCFEMHERDLREQRSHASAASFKSISSRKIRLSTFRSIGQIQSKRFELPIAAAALIAATVSLEIATIADSAHSTLTGSRIPLNLHSPLAAQLSLVQENHLSPENHPNRGEASRREVPASLLAPVAQGVANFLPVQGEEPHQPRSRISQESRSPQFFDFHPECGCAGDLLSS